MRHRNDYAGAASAEIAARVQGPRAVQSSRGFYNAYILGPAIAQDVALDDAGERTLEIAAA